MRPGRRDTRWYKDTVVSCVCVCVYTIWRKKSLTALIGFVLGKEMLIYCPAGDIIPIITDPGIGNSPGWRTNSRVDWSERINGHTAIREG